MTNDKRLKALAVLLGGFFLPKAGTEKSSEQVYGFLNA